MTTRTYSFIFLILLLLMFPCVIIVLTPYGNLPDNDIRLWITAISVYLVNAILLLLVSRNNKTSKITFWEGLSIICSATMSRFAKITILYIFPVLFFTYFIVLGNTIIGLFKGKEYTQAKWLKVIDWFVKRGKKQA